jgi:hypothetical protein
LRLYDKLSLKSKRSATIKMRQEKLFDSTTEIVSDERIVLYALGEFQARGKVLADRDLPLDRVRGALRRAADAFGIEMPSDERAVAALVSAGALVRRVPSFVAKHPFRVVVPISLAERAREFHQEFIAQRQT